MVNALPELNFLFKSENRSV